MRLVTGTTTVGPAAFALHDAWASHSAAWRALHHAPGATIVAPKVRQMILDCIRRDPGIHLRGIQRALGLPLGSVDYHLYRLQRNGLVVTRQDGRRKAFFLADGMDRRDRTLLYFLRQARRGNLLKAILDHPGVSYGELKQASAVTGSTMTYHLGRLLRAGILTQEGNDRSPRYRAVDPERLRALVERGPEKEPLDGTESSDDEGLGPSLVQSPSLSSGVW